MQKLLTVSLMLITVLTISTQNAAGLALNQSTCPVMFMPEAALQTSQRLIPELENKHPNSVADSRATPNKLVHSDLDAPPDASQTNPGNGQKKSPRHNHHVRNLVIFGVVLGIGFFCLAATAK